MPTGVSGAGQADAEEQQHLHSHLVLAEERDTDQRDGPQHVRDELSQPADVDGAHQVVLPQVVAEHAVDGAEEEGDEKRQRSEYCVLGYIFTQHIVKVLWQVEESEEPPAVAEIRYNQRPYGWRTQHLLPGHG